jgi:hypothetical protein
VQIRFPEYDDSNAQENGEGFSLSANAQAFKVGGWKCKSPNNLGYVETAVCTGESYEYFISGCTNSSKVKVLRQSISFSPPKVFIRGARSTTEIGTIAARMHTRIGIARALAAALETTQDAILILSVSGSATITVFYEVDVRAFTNQRKFSVFERMRDLDILTESDACKNEGLCFQIIDAVATGENSDEWTFEGASRVQTATEQTLYECARDGSDYYYRDEVSVTGAAARTIVSSFCPNHPYGEPAPRPPRTSGVASFIIPAVPRFSPNSTTSVRGREDMIGIFFNGAQVYSPFPGQRSVSFAGIGKEAINQSLSVTYLEGPATFDRCGCRGSSGTSKSESVTSYHCHMAPACLLAQLGNVSHGHSAQIGWAADGFPIYGPFGPQGILMKACSSTDKDRSQYVDADPCTDKCGGLAGNATRLGVPDAYMYRYYSVGQSNDGMQCMGAGNSTPFPGHDESTFPNTPACLRGCIPSSNDADANTSKYSAHAFLPACSSTDAVFEDGVADPSAFTPRSGDDIVGTATGLALNFANDLKCNLCTRPSAARVGEKYVDYNVQELNLTRDENIFSVIGWMCAKGYAGNSIIASVCLEDGAPYLVSGCSDECHPPVVLPAGYVGTMTGNFKISEFRVRGLRCAVGYSGMPAYTACSLDSRAVRLSGCVKTSGKCDRQGRDYQFEEKISEDTLTRVITTSFCPNHPFYEATGALGYEHVEDLVEFSPMKSPDAKFYVPAYPQIVGTRVNNNNNNNNNINSRRRAVTLAIRGGSHARAGPYGTHGPRGTRERDQAHANTHQNIPVVALRRITANAVESVSKNLLNQSGLIGMYFSGAQIQSPYPGGGRSATEDVSATTVNWKRMDQCGCYSSSSSVSDYHCSIAPSCLLHQLTSMQTSDTASHSPQLGWAADGFPVYGPHGPGGVVMRRCTDIEGFNKGVCTDGCGGESKLFR